MPEDRLTFRKLGIGNLSVVKNLACFASTTRAFPSATRKLARKGDLGSWPWTLTCACRISQSTAHLDAGGILGRTISIAYAKRSENKSRYASLADAFNSLVGSNPPDPFGDVIASLRRK